MILENPNVAVGQVPALSGNAAEDLQAMQAYLQKLVGLLERNFDIVQDRLEGLGDG